jgi:hypothetical protein
MLDLLERRIVERVTEYAACIEIRQLRRSFREAEVQENNPLATIELEILRLDVAMDDRRPVLVQVLEDVEYLIGPLKNEFVVKWLSALLQLPAEIVSGYELHYQELPVVLDEVIGYARQSRMIEAGKQSRFAFKSASHLIVVKKSLFECDDVAEAFVQGLVDGTHSSLPDHLENSVPVLEEVVCG